MPKVSYDDWMEDDPFHPCLKCGSEEFKMDYETSLYTCQACGETLLAPKQLKTRKVVRKPFRLEEDWD
jgi:DNA-directed RNA polymerase subunit RPC12/RpoP